MALVSCQNDLTPPEQDFASSQTDNRFTANELKAIGTAKSFITSLASTTRSGEIKEIGDVYPWLTSELFPASTRSASEELPDTLLYIVNFEDSEGFVLVHAQDSIGSILAYVEQGHLAPTDNIDPNSGFSLYLNGLQYLRPDPITPLPDDSTHLHGPDPVNPNFPNPNPTNLWEIDTLLTPLTHTKWGQDYPFNIYCLNSEGIRQNAGCVNISLAQAVAFHRHPSSYNGHIYNWNSILDGSIPTSPFGKESVAQLVHDISILTNTTYDQNGTHTYFPNQKKAYCLSTFGYHYSFSTYNYDLCMNEFSCGRPVIIGGYIPNSSSGHSWIVDGGLIRSLYVEYLDHTTYEPIRVLKSHQQLIHCNWGNEGRYNGYFLSGVFELAQRVLDDDQNVPENGGTANYDFSDDVTIFYEIYPNTNN